MRNVLMASAAAALLAACHLAPEPAPVPGAEPQAALAAPAAAEPPVNPQMEWGPTGKGLFIYHNISGDCAFLEHTHGRNGAWGLWRMPLGAVTSSGAAAGEGEGFNVTFTCTDDSACIEAGAFHKTPDRTNAHTIPFETEQGATVYLSQVAKLDQACRALK